MSNHDLYVLSARRFYRRMIWRKRFNTARKWFWPIVATAICVMLFLP